MRLSRILRAGVASAVIAAVAFPPAVLAGPSRPSASALDVRVGEAAELSRLEFHWRGGARMTARREGQRLVLRFSRDADPDISRLRVDPPRWLKGAEEKHVGGALELWLTLADDADARTGYADGSPYVTLFAKPAPAAAPVAEIEPGSEADARPSPVPVGGVVRMGAQVDGKRVLLTFPWANPGGAAVFRRGDAVWMVFDAPAGLDVAAAPRGLKPLSGVRAYKGADWSAVRIASPADIPVRVSQQGAVWTLALGGGVDAAPSMIRIARDDAAGPAGLTAAIAGVTRVVRVNDPVVGDTLTVATALGPAKTLPSRREYVQFAFLPTAHGLALETYAENVAVGRRGDLVSIAGPRGLLLSAGGARRGQGALEGAPQPAVMPGLIDYDHWPKLGAGGFLPRYNALVDAAAEETAKGKTAPVAARMALARFLVGSELSYEAIGVLNDLARANPQQLGVPEFRALRGIAKVMARRYDEAATDFASPALSDDPSSALWRSYIAFQTAHWEEARRNFAAGATALNQFSPAWRARFARADGQAALALGDFAGATARVNLALLAQPGPREDLFTRLLQARLLEAEGQKARALGIYQAVQKAPLEQVAAPALMRATQLRYEMGQLTPAQAAQSFDGLRYRWRGDATELETIRALGKLYLDQGRYREALEALRSAGLRLPDLPEALALQADLASTFRALFLDGMADGLEPVQALALFFDFKELTPIGADGDLMVRRLIRRLVDVDLLSQAADLLDYQANKRLDGVPRAQVATDLALIQLMDRKPEQALAAINASRTTVLPAALNAERRLIEGRALMQLGRFDQALEVIERENSGEAYDLRAEIMWREKNWPGAGAAFERSLGERWKNPSALSADEEGRLLRAGVAYSLAQDTASLNRLEGRWSGFYASARNPEALRVALTGASAGGVSAADVGRMTADAEAFAGWV
ncbi:MAG: endoglucanase, partial [Phenylobacterium sp.]